ncbi:MAG: TldD/PmbA family protein [Bacillota bacterium]
MLSKLKEALNESDCWTEIRYHNRQQSSVEIKNGEVSKVEDSTLAGAGIRCLANGSWGFAATADMTEEGLAKAVKEAASAARVGSNLRKKKIEKIAEGEIAKGKYNYVEKDDEIELSKKIKLFLDAEELIREKEDIISGIVNYSKYDDKKVIVNTDGAEVEIKDIKQDLGIIAVGKNESSQELGSTSAGVTGNWNDLFAERSLNEMVEESVKIARQKLEADYAQGGEYTVVLDPMLVGILSHEAIGHTVEADFVMSGSAAQGKIGKKVASEKITMVDDGRIQKSSGMTVVDDEGTVADRTTIIEDGIMKDYLHNRESAAEFAVIPKGNARAFTYRDQPIIRMTNTYIEAGEDSFEDMVAAIDEGYYLKGLGQGGQADASAEFMFGVLEAYKIENGEITTPVKGITISGQAFDVLKSVDAVGSDQKLKLGRGYCGKGQPAKVDAGGPHLRCKVTIGGKQGGDVK